MRSSWPRILATACSTSLTLTPTSLPTLKVLRPAASSTATCASRQIFDIDVIAYLLTLPVDRDRFVCQGVSDHVRDQVCLRFAQLVGAVRVEVAKDRGIEVIETLVGGHESFRGHLGRSVRVRLHTKRSVLAQRQVLRQAVNRCRGGEDDAVDVLLVHRLPGDAPC